jgi:putative transposase
MAAVSYPLRFLLVALAGWIHQQQRDVIDYLREENRVLREQLGGRRLRFTTDQRVRLAAKAKRLQRRVLQDIVSLVTPDTLLAWHRHFIARKHEDRNCRTRDLHLPTLGRHHSELAALCLICRQ